MYNRNNNQIGCIMKESSGKSIRIDKCILIYHKNC